jgi:hypothetical protein
VEAGAGLALVAALLLLFLQGVTSTVDVSGHASLDRLGRAGLLL